MKLLFSLTFFSWLTAVSAQIGVGQWRLHVPNLKAMDVAIGDGAVYAAFENGLLEYDIFAHEASLWTKVNSLSDLSLTCLHYNETNKALFVGYENGNLDMIVNNRVTNIPAIRLAQVSGMKRINHIVEHGKYIYLATGFSIVVIDPVKVEVRDTYYPTNGAQPIVDIAFRNDSIFALTEKKMYRGLITNAALADPAQWVVDARLEEQVSTLIYKEIEAIGDRLYVLKCDPAYGKDSVFNVMDAGLELVTDEIYDLEIHSMGNNNGLLTVNMDGGVYTYNTDYSHATTETNFSVGAIAIERSATKDGVTWMADSNNGLFKYENGIGGLIPFSGPPRNSFYAMDCAKGKLLVSGGGLDSKFQTYNTSGVYVLEDENWTWKNDVNMTLWKGQKIWDFVSVAINPKNVNQMAIGNFSEVMLSIIEDGNQVAETFTSSNSPLEPTVWNPEGLVSDLQYDSNGNLWVGNSYCSSPLKVYTSDKTWKTLNLGNSASNKQIRQIAIDFNGNKWISIAGTGLMALDDNGTIDTDTDDKIKLLTSGETTGALPSNEVTAIAVDLDNEIWIGTDNGFAILYNSAGVFDAAAGTYNAQRIKLDFEGNVEYLLGNTAISDIEVDGGNRKWLGTQGAGLFLLSADGSEILGNYTVENSPLISNTILEMEFDHNTGELFIITDQGLVSYRTDATYEDADYADVTVFPNPVRPEHTGPITIQGIRYDSDIHVTDAAGNLVYKTTSNGGTATWNGKTPDGQRVKSGVYLFWTAPNTGKGKKVGKVVLIN